MKPKNKKKTWIAFGVTLLIVGALFAGAMIKTGVYNRKVHNTVFKNESLFTEQTDTNEVSVNAVPRSSTWGKIFDFKNEGLTENNYQAFTYDFTVTNNTADSVAKFNFKLTFEQTVYLSSGWNGSVEIHQFAGGKEVVAKVPDLREFDAKKYDLDIIFKSSLL